MKTKTNDFFDVMTTRVDGFETVKSMSTAFIAQIAIVIGIYIFIKVALSLIGIGGLNLAIGFTVSIATTLMISLVQVYRKKRAFMHDDQ